MASVPAPNGQNPAANPAEKEQEVQTVARLPSALEKKAELLKTAYGWTYDHAKGYVDGAVCRMSGNPPSNYVLIGMHEYASGFRSGYFDRY